MKVIDHGWWRQYEPEKPPSYAPPTAVFIRRERDNVDWYDYVRPSDPDRARYVGYDPDAVSNFGSASVFCNVYYHKDYRVHVIGTAVRDPTRMFPINQRVIEIVGYIGSDPHAEFGGKVYDHEAGTFTVLVTPPAPPSPLEQKILDRIDAITARLEKLERKSNG